MKVSLGCKCPANGGRVPVRPGEPSFAISLNWRAGDEVEVVLIKSLDRGEEPAMRANIPRVRAGRDSRPAVRSSSTKPVNEVRFSAAFRANAAYCAATPPSRSSLHSSTTRLPDLDLTANGRLAECEQRPKLRCAIA